MKAPPPCCMLSFPLILEYWTTGSSLDADGEEALPNVRPERAAAPFAPLCPHPCPVGQLRESPASRYPFLTAPTWCAGCAQAVRG